MYCVECFFLVALIFMSYSRAQTRPGKSSPSRLSKANFPAEPFQTTQKMNKAVHPNSSLHHLWRLILSSSSSSSLLFSSSSSFSSSLHRSRSKSAKAIMEEDLFGCLNDGIGGCIYPFCCAPCALGSAAQNTDTGSCFVCCLCGPLFPCHAMLRQKVQEAVGAEVGAFLPNCLIAVCCAPCSVCQLYRSSEQYRLGNAGTGNNGAPEPVEMER